MKQEGVSSSPPTEGRKEWRLPGPRLRLLEGHSLECIYFSLSRIFLPPKLILLRLLNNITS